MTTTLAVPHITPPSLEDEGSVVAITLAWPWQLGHSPDEGGITQVRGSHIIELIGDIDYQLATQVRDILRPLATKGVDLTVDVSRVSFIDAGGLGMLATLYWRVRESGGQLSLTGATASLSRILRLTRLTYLLARDPSGRSPSSRPLTVAAVASNPADRPTHLNFAPTLPVEEDQ
jgi:anti-sigma B factor antagonist